MTLPVATLDWEKMIGSSWCLEVKLPGKDIFRDCMIIDLPTAIAKGWGVCAVLDKGMGIVTTTKCSPDNPGFHYVGDDGVEYASITCKQGNKRLVKRDSQMRIGTYVDYVSAGYSWVFEDKTKHGVRVVGHETIYTDWWITGSYFYMTNDSKLDSVDLGNVRRNTVVEFIPLIAVRCEEIE